VLFPISDERLRERVRKEVQAPLAADDSRVYEMDSDGNYRRREPKRADAPVDGQVFAYERVNEQLSTRAPESSAQPVLVLA